MKKFTKVLAVLTIISILATTGFVSRKSAVGSNSSPSYGLTNVKFPLAKTVTLKFLTQSSPLAPQDPNKKLIYQRLEKATNVHIEWTNYTWDQFADKRNLEIASGDLPDAIFDAALSDYDILRYAKQGIIVPIDPIITKYMPNLRNILAANPTYKKAITTPDGHAYSFPWIEELGAGKKAIQAIDDIPWISTKMLKEVGMKMPTTTDELEKVLLAFKAKVPGCIPMSFRINGGGEDPAMLLSAFGFGDNYDHYMVTDNKKVIYTSVQDGYKAGIAWLHKLQTEGLIDPEAFTQDWNTFVAKGKAQKYGMFFTWDDGNVSGIKTGYATYDQSKEDYAPMPVLAGPSGKANLGRTNGAGFDKGRMVITAANQNVELTAKWIDKLYEPVQSVQDNWGTYGDTTQANIFALTSKGTLKHLPLNGVAPGELRGKTMIGGPLAILDSYYGKYTTKPDDAAWRLKIQYSMYVPHMNAKYNYPVVFMSAEDQTKVTQLELAVKALAERKKAEWILKGGIETQWAQYLKDMDKAGLPELMKIKQKYFDVVYGK